jgi:hypothetical protein
MEERHGAVGVFVNLDGHLDEMPAVPLLRNLQYPPLIAHAIVAADDALALDAQDVAQAGRERHESLPLRRRGALPSSAGAVKEADLWDDAGAVPRFDSTRPTLGPVGNAYMRAIPLKRGLLPAQGVLLQSGPEDRGWI